MNLLERSKALTTEVAALVGWRERAEHAGLIEKRAKAIDDQATSLAALHCAARVMLEHGLEVPELNRELVAVLRTRTADLQRRFAEDKGVMRDPFAPEDFRYVYTVPLGQCAAASRAALEGAWKAWAQRQLPRLDEEILKILAAIPALQEAVVRVRNLHKLAMQRSATLPDSPAAVTMLTSLAAEIAEAWRSLAGEGIDAEVLEFLRAAGSVGGAPYEMLTPGVLRWLQEHCLAHTLRVHMG